MVERGSRRKAARKSGSRRKRRPEPKPQRGAFARWTRRIVFTGIFVALMGALFLGLAVLFAARSLPGYYDLKAQQTGQTIVVRARDGTQIVELGPSYGQWLESGEIPQVMKEAMISVEDRRYYSHYGVDPLGLMRAVYSAA